MLGAVTRWRSMSSAPKALMTAIAESASVAREAISPSWWRWRRDAARTRMRKRKLTKASSGSETQSVSASTGSRIEAMTSIPNSSSRPWKIWPIDCAKRSPIELTSEVTRVTRSPFSRRRWKCSDSACRWS